MALTSGFWPDLHDAYLPRQGREGCNGRALSVSLAKVSVVQNFSNFVIQRTPCVRPYSIRVRQNCLCSTKTSLKLRAHMAPPSPLGQIVAGLTTLSTNANEVALRQQGRVTKPLTNAERTTCPCPCHVVPDGQPRQEPLGASSLYCDWHV